MLRKWILASVGGLGLLTSAAFTPKAQAGDVRIGVNFGSGYYGGYGRYGSYGGYGGYSGYSGYVGQRGYGSYRGYSRYGYGHYSPPIYSERHYRPQPVQPDYQVYYRQCANDSWQLYGTYNSHSSAHEIMDRIEQRGFEVKMAHN